VDSLIGLMGWLATFISLVGRARHLEVIVVIPDFMIYSVHTHFMSSILTCGPLLHLFKRILLNTSSIMPLDGAPTTPTWPWDLVSRRPSLFHNLLFRPWSWSRNFNFKMGSWELRELPPTWLFLFNCTQFIMLLMHASFWQLVRIFGSPKRTCMLRHICCVLTLLN
jgi:hypothetical protein